MCLGNVTLPNTLTPLTVTPLPLSVIEMPIIFRNMSHYEIFTKDSCDPIVRMGGSISGICDCISVHNKNAWFLVDPLFGPISRICHIMRYLPKIHKLNMSDPLGGWILGTSFKIS